MARIFITGSADGLGHLTAKSLVAQGHGVVLHARSTERAKQTIEKISGAESVLVADLASIDETIKLADEVNALGKFDAIIHNAGVYRTSGEIIFAVNTLAPYILTCLIQKPTRLIYLSSGMHSGGNPNRLDSDFANRRTSYSDSKFHDVILTMAVARNWPDVYANAVNPGWVSTKMGGPGAPDDLKKGYQTQEWLAVSDEDAAKVTGKYFYHKKQQDYLSAAEVPAVQESFLSLCEQVTGVRFPGE